MIAPLAYQPTVKMNIAPMPVQSHGLSRMFAAAVVNRQFCEMLLNNPREALNSGYQGEIFPLTTEELDLIDSIRAKSLSDFARQINRRLKIKY